MEHFLKREKKHFYDFWRLFKWQKKLIKFYSQQRKKKMPLWLNVIIFAEDSSVRNPKNRQSSHYFPRVVGDFSSFPPPPYTVVSPKFIRCGKLKSFSQYDCKWWSRWNNPFVFTLNINGINKIEVVVVRNVKMVKISWQRVASYIPNMVYLSINKNRFICKSTILEGY